MKNCGFRCHDYASWSVCRILFLTNEPPYYILTTLFLKYMSDVWKDKRREFDEKYKGDKERVKRALNRERFVVPDECDFDYQLIEENLLEAVIGLPATLFFGTGIPAAILIFNKGKKNRDVLFIDASREFLDDKKQNRLRTQDIDKIVGTFQKFKNVPKYAHRAKFKEIEENEFNLNIPRYVDTSEEEKEIDVAALQTEIEGLESELAKTRKEMKKHLEELGMVE